MAEMNAEKGSGWRARTRVRGMVVAVLLSLLTVAAALPVQAGAATTDPPASAASEAPVEGAPSNPAYVGAPWFQPSVTYNQNFPDPAVVWDGSRYWAYATSTGGSMMPAMWSTDLVTWTARDAYRPNPYNSDRFFNDAFPVPPSWSAGGTSRPSDKAQWAPGVAKVGGSWVAYTSWEIEPGRRCISVASSATPAGPFVDSSSAPLVCDVDRPGSIDPAPFLDANGQPWLTWKAEGDVGIPSRIYSQPLSPDGLHLKAGSSPSLLVFPVRPWEGTIVENPSMTYADGAYWLLYSANDWASGNYRMGQVRCDTPAGPCRFSSDRPLIDNTSTELSPGGGSLFVDASGRTRLAYQVWNAPYTSYPSNANCDGGGQCTSQGQRFLRIDGVTLSGGKLTVDPIGSLDSVSSSGGTIDVAGWALDPSTPSSIAVHVYVDGTLVALAANGPRPDVGAAFTGLGAGHGFSASIPAGPGVHQVCAYGIDVGAGGNALIGCRSVNVSSGPPYGSLDVAAGAIGGVAVGGWAIDPDSAGAIAVHAYLDGSGTALTANAPRPDVAAALSVGPDHGFSALLPAAPGPHQLCAFGINVGVGSNTLLGCREVVVPGGPPIGSLDVAVGGLSSISVGGWAIDPDTAAPIAVHVYVDGSGTALTANGSRPDVGAFFGPYGSAHGFSATIGASAGPHSVCAYGINVGVGYSTLIGCRQVVVADTSPFGSLDLVAAAPGGLRVAGWAIDPDTNDPIAVHVYVDGAGTVLQADQWRPDVGSAYPTSGPGHGFGAVVATGPGPHTACSYGINVAGGGNVLLGCRAVVVP